MVRSMTRILATVGGLVLLIGIGAVAAVATGVVQPVGVQEVNHEWGSVNAQTTEVQTTVLLTNAGPFGYTADQVDIQYSGTLNGISFFSGEKENIAVQRGQNQLRFSTEMPTSKIPAWWRTHINNGEQSTMKTSSNVIVSTPLGTVPLPGPSQQQQISSDILANFNTNQDREVAAFGRTLLVIKEKQASWRQATEQRTPIDAQIRVHNPNRVPLVFSRIAYTIKMNDVQVGQGETEERIQIGPRSTETVNVDAAINNGQLDEWWVTHHNRGQTTTVTIQFSAIIEFRGQQQRIPIGSASKTMEIELLPSDD